MQGDHFLLLHLLAEKDDGTRIGVTVSSKVGGAVVRNRLKRWVREYLRRHPGEWPAGDLVLVARTSAARIAHGDLDRDLSRLFARATGGRR